MKLFNTLGRKLETFKPLDSKEVKIYTCGPTVYDFQHIGNYSGYIYWDILVRLFKLRGYKVKRVMNITDVGHLMSDADEGEDKLEKGAHREGKSAQQIADFYTADFLNNMKALNLVEPDIYARASEYIPQQLEMINTLIDKGFAYRTKQAIYFDVSKLSNYGQLAGQKLSEKEVAVRPEVVTDPDKHSPQDFAVWFFATGRFEGHQMRWPSQWGEGFPGWHIECSAIIHATLGEPIDVHGGGIDHIGTHHPNEMAQTEAAYGKPLSRFWLHNNHMMVEGKKMSKSAGGFLTLKDLADRRFEPMDFKLLVLQSHYRSQSNFTWQAIEAAKNLYKDWQAWADSSLQADAKKMSAEDEANLKHQVITSLENDLDTVQAVSAISQYVGGAAPSSEFLKFIDAALGFKLSARKDIEEHQKKLITEREAARKQQNWPKADELRVKLLEQGIDINDTSAGPIWFRV